MAMPTLLDVIKANNADAEVGLVEEALSSSPEATYAAARPIKGVSYYTMVRTALPTAGFRNANEGVTPSLSAWENRLIQTFILNPRWECDKAIADGYEDGHEAFIALEADAQVRASLITLGKQFYYGTGTGGDAKGHPGLLAAYDSTNMVVDATGTTATTGSSVWGVKFGPQMVQFVMGNNGSLGVGELTTGRVTDSNSKPFTAYIQEMIARVGLQVSNIRCIGRIKKLTADSGKGLTDALLSQLYEKFPIGYKPDAFFMSRRSLGQLQRSRTATTPTGATAPIPVESADGVKIVATDSILDTEDLAL